jgi:hypothetical protein
MKNCLMLLAALSAPTWADDGSSIPTDEDGFITAIQAKTPKEITELLGDPPYHFDIRDKEGQIVGNIWHYHYVTTSPDGQYYKTTELDFIGDKVVTVVLINTDDDEDTSAALECTTTATC